MPKIFVLAFSRESEQDLEILIGAGGEGRVMEVAGIYSIGYGLIFSRASSGELFQDVSFLSDFMAAMIDGVRELGNRENRVIRGEIGGEAFLREVYGCDRDGLRLGWHARRLFTGRDRCSLSPSSAFLSPI